MNSVKYIDSLTPMRGVAALWVMLFHIDVSLFYRDMGALVSRDATGILSKGYLWVDFFFILSGFIMAHVYGEGLSQPRMLAGRLSAVGDYLWARLVRIYPLHLFCLGLVILIAVTYPLFLPQVKDGSWETFMAWKAIPSNLLLTHAMNQHVYLSWDIVSWSIGAEWWTYVATFGLIIVLHRAPAIISVIAATIAFGLLAGLVYALPDKNLDITFNWGFFRCLFEFVVGLGVYRAWREGWFKTARHDVVIIGLFAATAVIFHFKVNDLLMIPLFAMLILGLSYNRGLIHGLLQTPPLQYLGRISYSLYLMHGVAFSAFWFLMPWIRAHYGVPSVTEKMAYAAAFIALVIAASHLTYVFVERPARLALLRLRHGAKPHGAI